METLLSQSGALRVAHRRLDRFVRARLAPLGLTPARFELLCVLEREGPIAQRVLPKILDVSRSNVTHLLRALEVGELVHRAPSAFPARRRVGIVVTLTPEGAALLRAGRAAMRELTSAPARPEPRGSPRLLRALS